MSSKTLIVALAASLTAIALASPHYVAEAGDPPRLPTAAELGGSERYLAYVSTDKPIYREGEAVRVRAILLHAFNRKPYPGWAQAQLQVLGPKGDTVLNTQVQLQDGILGFAWPIPEGTAGGEHVVKLEFPQNGFSPAERKIEIRAYRPPRLNGQITFARDGYGPGDTVSATLHVERAEGGIPAGAKVTAIARVDGNDLPQVIGSVDAGGDCVVSFALPKAIERGEGTLAMVIEDGGVVETESKTIPILVSTVDLAFYPEGGDLIAGLPNRVYLEARTPAQKPADLEGVIVDEDGRTVCEVKTEHEGRGRFSFTPKKGERYLLKINKPSGISRTFALPEVNPAGALIQSVDDISQAGASVRLRVATTQREPVTLTLSQREVELASVALRASTQLSERSLQLPAEVAGTLIATVWDLDGRPLAERLVFRRPGHAIDVKVTASKKTYAPGDAVELSLVTTSGGKPVSAVVGLSVTDESVLELLEKREQAPRLPAMAFLETEVRELYDAHVYLDAANAKSGLAVDLLLGTQGWRRFALVSWREFLAKNEDKARRVLAQQIVQRPVAMDHWAEGAAVPGMAKAANGEPAAERSERRSARAPRAAAPPPMAAPAPRPSPARPPQLKKDAVLFAKPMPARPEMKKEIAAAPRMGGRADVAGRLRAREKVAAMVTVREYAHPVRPERKPNERTDFTETLYWNAGLATDAQGKATVRFALSDSVTTFRVLLDAHDKDGALGSGIGAVQSVEPFYAETKLPLEVTAGDTIALPVTVVNATDSVLKDGTLAVSAAKGIRISGGRMSQAFGAGRRQRQIVELFVGQFAGKAQITVAAKGGNYSDTLTRELNIKPAGFPVEVASGGMLEPDTTATIGLDIPQSYAPGSLATDIAVFPAPLGNLTAALERLIQEPYGCFEQTSSTSYPLVMAQQYFMTHTGVDAAVITRSRDTLRRGYDRLRGFECKGTGYEWFGQDPGHEALSAYGLMEFVDMAKVMQVDMGMVDRTRAWILGKRDGRGGFKSERRALHTWLVEPDLHNGYITWALLEAGERGLSKESASFKDAALGSANSYVIALGANVSFADGDKSTARRLMDKLVAKQTKDGWVDGSTTSIVGSGGEALRIETTSLAVLAWLRDPAYAGAVENAMRYITESCKGGRYGSTQSTVLALRAILAYDKSRTSTRKGGGVQLLVDGKPVGEPVQFAADTQTALKLPDAAERLKPGRRNLQLKLLGGGRMPFTVAVRYHALTPDSSQAGKVGLEAALRSKRIEEGAASEIDVTVRNLSQEPIPMPVALIGVPGGLEVRHDQLKELRQANRIAAYEVIGRDVVLYWRELAAGQTVQLPLSVVAAVPGQYTGPASRAYQYYVDEYKRWFPGLQVEITPRRAE